MWELYQRRLYPTIETKIKQYLWVKDGVVVYQRCSLILGWRVPEPEDIRGRTLQSLRGQGFTKNRTHKMSQEELAEGWLIL